MARSLAEIMAEELAEKLQAEENRAFCTDFSVPTNTFTETSDEAAVKLEEEVAVSEVQEQMTEQCGDGKLDEDFLLALALAEEEGYNVDELLSGSELHTGPSRVASSKQTSLQSTRYGVGDWERVVQDEALLEDEQYARQLAERYNNTSTKVKRPRTTVGAGRTPTKHDPVVCARRNAEKLEQFELVGDLGDEAHLMTNRVFNSLHKFLNKQSIKGQAAHGKVEQELHATEGGVMDNRTRMIVFKLLNSGRLGSLGGVIRAGKEALVYYGRNWDDEAIPTPPLSGGEPYRGDVAIKIFKLTVTEFTNRADYVEGDFRFRHLNLSHQNPRKMVAIWAEKEIKNLHRMWRVGIPCPRPLLLRGHVIAMQLIGREGQAAPQLREVPLTKSQARRAYTQVIKILADMFSKCNLVHADLSEYNILYDSGVCFVVDVGQAVDISHPNMKEFLKRDISNINKFFGSHCRTVNEDALLVAVLEKSLDLSSFELPESLFEAPSSEEYAAATAERIPISSEDSSCADAQSQEFIPRAPLAEA